MEVVSTYKKAANQKLNGNPSANVQNESGVTATSTIPQTPPTVNPDTPQTPAQMVADFAQTIEGDKGRSAMAGMYRPEQSPTDYIKSMMGVYNAGRQGMPQAQVDAGVLNPQQADAAYAAGQMDAMTEQASAAKAQQDSSAADNTKIPTNSENAQGVTGMNEQNMHDTDGKDGANKPKLLEIGDNDSPAVKTAKRVANILTERFGVEFEMYAADGGMDGHFDPDTKKIYINENAESPMLSVVAHEFLHSFKVMDTAGYNILKRITESDLNLARFNEYKKALLAAYDEKGIEYKHLDPDDLHDLVVEEAMCDLVGEMVNDPTTIERIARHDRGLVQRIMDYLGELIDTIRAHFTESDTEIQKLVDNYEQLKAVYQEVIGTSNTRMENVGTVEGGRKYSIYKIGNKLRVVVDNDILKGVPKKDVKKTVKNYIRTAYKDGVISLDGKMKTQVDKQGAEEFVYSDYTSELSNAERMDKYRMGGNLDEIIQSQQNSRLENTNHERDDDIVSFYRSDVQVQVGTKLYECELITALTSDGKEKFYDVVDLNLINEKEGNPSLADKIQVNGRHGSPSANRIPQDGDSVNTNIRQSNQNDTSGYNEEMLRKFQEAGIDVGDAGKKIDLAKGDRAKVFHKGSRGAKAQEMLDRYEGSGKSTAALPDMGWARTYRRDAEKKNKYLANQIETAEFELEAGNKTPDRSRTLKGVLFYAINLCNLS